MGANQVGYYANRRKLLVGIALSAAFGVFFLWMSQDSWLRGQHFTGAAAFLGLMPIEGRLAVVYGLAAIMLFPALGDCRFLIHPKIAIVGDDGLSVSYALFRKTGLWRTFQNVRSSGRTLSIVLEFGEPNGRSQKLAIACLLDQDAFLTDVRQRIARYPNGQARPRPDPQPNKRA